MQNCRVALVDDHKLFREGLRALLAQEPGFEVVAEASEATEAYPILEAADPDVVVLDIGLPGANGISVARELLRRNPRQRLLVLSMFLDEERVAQALDAGVLGYAGKDQSSDEVIAALRTVANGKPYLAPSVSRFVLEDYLRLRKNGGDPSSPLRALTNREREIFDLTVRGLSNDAIATQLFISKRTVETHRSRILRKRKVHSLLDLFRLAVRHHLVTDQALYYRETLQTST